MKRTGVTLLVMALFLSACIPGLPTLQPPDNAPIVDVQATDAALALTLAVETLNALPTPTLEPATNTPAPTATFTESPTATTEPATNTSIPDPNAPATNTVTPNPSVTTTATGTLTATVTVTGTLPTATPFTPTATETLHARFYGTLPPALPSGKVSLINRSKAEVYVSLQCTTVDGYTTIIEYPVPKGMRVSAPAGSYTYVAWVGGRQFEGSFNLGKNNEVVITFMKDKVTVTK
ncbi:MAG: hypothetical protein AB8I58_07490 [Anaerolineales bacterium]